MFFFLLLIAIIYDFLNGFHDSSNIVATVISSRAMRPHNALILTAAAHFIAPFLFGVAVATTVGKDLIDPQAVTLSVIISAIIAAIIWNVITWFIGIPSSSSHALVGGLLGAAILSEGIHVVQLGGLLIILAALIISPPLGFLTSYILTRFTLTTFNSVGPRINIIFKRLQIITSLSLALSHGTNDAQKTMGIITMGLVASGFQSSFYVPLWVIMVSAGAISLGTIFGGWRLIKTLGGRIMKIRPVDAFSSQAASAVVILGAALWGGPVSTSQVVGSSIMGSGAAVRPTKVRWQVGQEMMVTWLLTIPVTALMSAILNFILQNILLVF